MTDFKIIPEMLSKGLYAIFIEHRLPWRVERVLIHARVNQLRWLWTKIHFLIYRPTLRILLSSHFFGGVGGTEKLLMSVVNSMPDCEFFIIADEIQTKGFVPSCSNYYIGILPSRRKPPDTYLYFCGGGKPKFLGDRYPSTVKVVDTNAANIRDIEECFDYILMQSREYDRYCSHIEKCVLAFLDVTGTFPKRRKVVQGLPEKYYVTVFNPFSKAQKGQEVMYRVVADAGLPVVWCYSDASGWDFSTVPDVPNLIKCQNLSQEELYYVYEHATAYVSFAFYESFGWTLAEAFYLNLPIISRNTGIINFVHDQHGIDLYETEEQLAALLRRTDYAKPEYEKRFFEEQSYALVLRRLARRETP